MKEFSWVGYCLSCFCTDCRRIMSGRWVCNRCGFEASLGYRGVVSAHRPDSLEGDR